jgi:hypothetical protein
MSLETSDMSNYFLTIMLAGDTKPNSVFHLLMKHFIRLYDCTGDKCEKYQQEFLEDIDARNYEGDSHVGGDDEFTVAVDVCNAIKKLATWHVYLYELTDDVLSAYFIKNNQILNSKINEYVTHGLPLLDQINKKFTEEIKKIIDDGHSKFLHNIILFTTKLIPNILGMKYKLVSGKTITIKKVNMYYYSMKDANIKHKPLDLGFYYNNNFSKTKYKYNALIIHKVPRDIKHNGKIIFKKGDVPFNMPYLRLLLNRNIRKRLLNLILAYRAAEIKGTPLHDYINIYISDVSQISNIISRHPESKEYKNKGRFLVNGKEVNEKDNCHGTVISKNNDVCYSTMYDCLMNDDLRGLRKCIATLSSSSTDKINKNIEAELKNASPLALVRLLQRLGFKSIEIHDSVAKRILNKIQSVESWLESVNETLKITDAKDSLNKNVLLTYLRKVVFFINANPAILNKNYNGKTLESEFSKGIALPPSPPSPPKPISHTTIIKENREQLQEFIRNLDNPFNSGLIPPDFARWLNSELIKGTFPLPKELVHEMARTEPSLLEALVSGAVYQFGGNMSKQELQKRVANTCSGQMSELYNMLNTKLQRNGKKLDVISETKILAHLKNLCDNENELNKDLLLLYEIVDQFEFYRNMQSTLTPLGQANNTKLDEIHLIDSTLENLKKRAQKMDNRLEVLADVYNRLSKIVNTDGYDEEEYKNSGKASNISIPY